MHKTHFLNGNNKTGLLYKKFAYELNKTKFAAKKRFFLQQSDQSKLNPRKNWKVDQFTTNQKQIEKLTNSIYC